MSLNHFFSGKRGHIYNYLSVYIQLCNSFNNKKDYKMSSVRFKSYKMITHIKRSMPWIPEYLKCWIYKLWHTQGDPQYVLMK